MEWAAAWEFCDGMLGVVSSWPRLGEEYDAPLGMILADALGLLQALLDEKLLQTVG
jgi:hypothetical protein